MSHNLYQIKSTSKERSINGTDAWGILYTLLWGMFGWGGRGGGGIEEGWKEWRRKKKKERRKEEGRGRGQKKEGWYQIHLNFARSITCLGIQLNCGRQHRYSAPQLPHVDHMTCHTPSHRARVSLRWSTASTRQCCHTSSRSWPNCGRRREPRTISSRIIQIQAEIDPEKGTIYLWTHYLLSAILHCTINDDLCTIIYLYQFFV